MGNCNELQKMKRIYSVTLATSDPDVIAAWINRHQVADSIVSIQFIESVASFVVFYLSELNPYQCSMNNIKE
jgi:hypothetical protein